MKGLFLNSFLNFKSMLLHSSIFLLFTSFIGILENDHNTSSILLLTTFPTLYLMLEQKQKNNWGKLEKLFPIKPNRIVLVKYVNFIFALLLGLVLLIIYVHFNYFIRNVWLSTILFKLLIWGFGLMLNLASIYFPIVFILDSDISRIILLPFLAIPLLNLIIIFKIGMLYSNGNTYLEIISNNNVLVIYLISCSIIYVCSYFSSSILYKYIEI